VRNSVVWLLLAIQYPPVKPTQDVRTRVRP
jgi:hypothetical protein